MLCYSCPIYTFFSQLCPGRTPGRILTVYGLNVALSPKDVLLGVSMTTRNLRGSTLPPQKKNQNGAWLGIFQPNWQHHKFAISPTAKIGSTPNSNRVIEPHSWLRGWSRITKLKFKIADGHNIGKYWKYYNSLTNGPIWTKLGWSHLIMSPTCLPWCGYHSCLATAHWTFSSYGRLEMEAERVNRFWWNLV